METYQQLRFGFYETNPRLLILGPDPQHPQQVFVRCPICGTVRSLTRHSIYGLREKGHSICLACAQRKAGRQKLEPIPESSDCIILEQRHSRRSVNTLALVKCPRCGAVAPRARQDIRAQGHTLCGWCARHERAITIPNTSDCIILKQFTKRGKHGAGYARVQCPDCGKRYLRRRDSIMDMGHTLCASCARKGERSALWRGGSIHPAQAEWRPIAAWIRERDKFRCQFPGCNAIAEIGGRNLSVHHVVPFEQSDDNSRFNLITLCDTHHVWADHNLPLSIPMFENVLRMMYGPDYPR